MHFRILILLFFCGSRIYSQDTQFSQYYNAPLYLNPAFAGTAENSRVVLNYRNQWPGITNPYLSYAASFDHNIEPYKSGVGLLLKKDTEGSSGLTSTDIALMYSYQVNISSRITFRPAIQASFNSRSLNYFGLTFGDQLTDNGATGSASSENIDRSRFSYMDFSAGGLLYTENFWLGIASNHLNTPNQSFTDNVNVLPVKTSIHTGYKFFLSEKTENMADYRLERSIIPTLLYKAQGKFDQLDIGTYLILEPVMFGLWYRGLPIKTYQGLNNREALIFMAGLYYKMFTIGYSYDYTISNLTTASAGAHEISIIYEFEIPYSRKKKKIGRPIPCPKFYKRKSFF